MTATTHGVNDTPILAACRCGDDPQLQVLRDLMNAGLGQIEASRIAFGTDPGPHGSPTAWSAWVKVEVRKLGNVARRQLGLPELPLVEAVTRCG